MYIIMIFFLNHRKGHIEVLRKRISIDWAPSLFSKKGTVAV